MRRLLLARTLPLLAVLVVALMPSSAVQPTTMRLVDVQGVSSVDTGDDGVTWVLLLGSDASGTVPLEDGQTDAIQLLGLHPSGAAAAIGIPRDTLVDLGDERGRINTALDVGGPSLIAEAVQELVGIAPDYVLVVGAEGYLGMADVVGEVEVRATEDFVTDDGGMRVRRGVNTFSPEETLDFARTRKDLSNYDFTRVANHQALLLGLLMKVQEREDEEGFMEQVTLAGLSGFQAADAVPTDLYRLAQAVTQIRPDRVSGCVVPGTTVEIAGASYVEADEEVAERLGSDAETDAVLEPGCRG